MSDSSENPKVTGREVIASGAAVALQRLTWTDAQGEARFWDTAERVNSRGAVLMIPRLRPSDRLVLIRQFRPPAGDCVLEFPAGLIDKGDTPESAALRELAEETGYHGRIARMTPPTFNSPGLTSETVYQCWIDIDETHEDNRNPVPAPEGTEHIEVVLVPMKSLAEFLQNAFLSGEKVDSKVAAYILGVEGKP